MTWSQGFLSTLAPRGGQSQWHVGVAADLSAYAFSWLWVLLPLALLPDPKPEWIGLYVVIVALSDVHRHFGLPYVYLDREVFGRFPLRFSVVPVLLFATWALSPWWVRHGHRITTVGLTGMAVAVVVLVTILGREKENEPLSWRPWSGWLFAYVLAALCVPAVIYWQTHDVSWTWLAGALLVGLGVELAVGARVRRSRFYWYIAAVLCVIAVASTALPQLNKLYVRPREVVNTVAVVAGVWNIWHVLMQKYGILRMYNAKIGPRAGTPGWVDRLLVFGWLPLLFVFVGTQYREAALSGFRRGAGVVAPLIDGLTAIAPYALVPCAALAVASAVVFVIHETRGGHRPSPARMWMALGTTLLMASFLVVHPLKAYVAFAFSHAIEYMVFVAAFQRKRYSVSLSHNPPLARLLRHPVLTYGVFILGGTLTVIALKYYGRTIFTDQPMPRMFEITTAEWFLYWSVYQSLMHFYYDGFMWKMRRATTRQHL